MTIREGPGQDSQFLRVFFMKKVVGMLRKLDTLDLLNEHDSHGVVCLMDMEVMVDN